MGKVLFKTDISDVAVSPISFMGTRVQLVSVMSFDNDQKEEINMLKLRQQSGEFNIMCDKELADKLKPYKGECLKVSGIVKHGKKVSLELSSIELVD